MSSFSNTRAHKLLWFFILLLSVLVSGAFTYLLIVTSIDWNWAVYFSEHVIWVYLASPFVLAGMVIPLIIPGFFYVRYRRKRRSTDYILFIRSLLAFCTSYVVMTVLKVFTNRVDMEPFEPIGTIDTSDQFRFGFMNSNSWWESFSEGWPSGHTMIAVSMAITIHSLLQSKASKWLNVSYAVLVSLSVSTAFHWLSDIVSGCIIGVVIGIYFSRYEVRDSQR